MDYNFYDARSFIRRLGYPLNNENIIICNLTIGYILDNKIDVPQEFRDNVEVLDFKDFMEEPFEKFRPEEYWVLDDIESLMTAFYYDTYYHPDETIFVSSSPKLCDLANRFFGDDSIKSFENELRPALS